MKNNVRIAPMAALVMLVITSLACDAASQFMPTPTPTLTLTPTSTPSPTATPTQTPTVTPTPPPDISSARIRLEDLPPGFEEFTPEEMGMDPADFWEDEFRPEEIFIFINSSNFQMIMGFNFLLDQRIDRVGFDSALNTPDLIMDSFLSGLGTEEVSNQKVLEGMEDIGEAQIVMTMDTNLEGVAMSTDVLMLRRDIVGGMLISMYLQGNEPSISIRELGLLFDSNIQSTLENTP